MKTMRVKVTLGAVVVAAGLVLANGSAAAAPANNAASVANGIESNHAAGATDMSARRRHLRRHRFVQPYYPYYGRPYPYAQPYPSVYSYPYGYYRPRPYYYRPYYGPGPFFSIGFGPRRFW